MIKLLKTSALLLFPSLLFAQNEQLGKELAENACQCVNKIDENKLLSRVEFYDKIRACIDEQVMAYQLADKLKAIELPTTSAASDTEKNIDISINTNPESQDYKTYYHRIESLLMDHCKNLKDRIAASEIGMESEIPSNNKKALQHYSEGIEYVKQENWTKAATAFRKAVKEDPSFTYAWDNLGVNLRRLNQFSESIAAYESSLKIDPYGRMPLQNIAVVYIHQQEYQKALAAYERYKMVYPDYVETYYGLANVYINHVDELEKGLDNACIAFHKYTESKSPYRSDAEKLIGIAYNRLKAKGEEHKFYEILEKNNISIGKN